jgi:hypothetical protein
MGKSRLVRELARHTAQGSPGPVWRQGRCVPFGDGGSYVALAQIVKAHGGILDTDAPATVEEKLRDVLTGVEPARRRWVQTGGLWSAWTQAAGMRRDVQCV